MAGNALTMDFSGFDKYEADKMMLSLVGQLQDMGVTKHQAVEETLSSKLWNRHEYCY